MQTMWANSPPLAPQCGKHDAPPVQRLHLYLQSKWRWLRRHLEGKVSGAEAQKPASGAPEEAVPVAELYTGENSKNPGFRSRSIARRGSTVMLQWRVATCTGHGFEPNRIENHVNLFIASSKRCPCQQSNHDYTGYPSYGHIWSPGNNVGELTGASTSTSTRKSLSEVFTGRGPCN